MWKNEMGPSGWGRKHDGKRKGKSWAHVKIWVRKDAKRSQVKPPAVSSMSLKVRQCVSGLSPASS